MAEEIRKGFKDKAGNKVSIIAKVINAITGHFAGLNKNGEVVDSGYGPSDFAAKEHTHEGISNAGSTVNINENGNIRINPKSGAGAAFIFGSDITDVTSENVANLKRALRAPDEVPTQGSDNLIKSGAVFTELAKKNEIPVVHFTKANASTSSWTLNNDDETVESYHKLMLNSGSVIVSAEIGTDKRYFLGAFDVEEDSAIPQGGGVPAIFGYNIRFYVDGNVFSIYNSGVIVPAEISRLSSRTLTKTTDSFAL